MSDDTTNFGFARLVPGFDFLQNLAKGTSQSMPGMPSLSNWIAPTLNVEELDKRIAELKAVHFWLDQNSKALTATIQALEVQKMTLATLHGMNVSMGQVADALKLKPQPPAAAKAASAPAEGAPKRKPADEGKAKPASGNGSAPVDPLQWWGALTQQFGEIATNAMKDVAQKTAMEPPKAAAGKAVGKTAAKPARKSAPRKSGGRKAASPS